LSPNQKKALALFVAFLISIIAGLSAALAMNNMVEDASGWACLGLGCAVWLAMFFGSAGVIGLFEFTDTRPKPESPLQVPPNQPGAPVA
jgi:hypothetical protein